jgi:hypothetical protein
MTIPATKNTGPQICPLIKNGGFYPKNNSKGFDNISVIYGDRLPK